MSSESKATICHAFAEALQTTVNGQDVVDIEYHMLADGTEVAFVVFKNGAKKGINITADSGTAIMRDILNHCW